MYLLIIYNMYKQDLALNNLQWLVYLKTQPNQSSYLYSSNDISACHHALLIAAMHIWLCCNVRLILFHSVDAYHNECCSGYDSVTRKKKKNVRFEELDLLTNVCVYVTSGSFF